MGFPFKKVFVCIQTGFRPSSCGMLVSRRSSNGHYTCFMTKCRSRVLPAPIFKPSLGRREKLPQKVGRREIYPPVPPPLSNYYRIPINTVFAAYLLEI